MKTKFLSNKIIFSIFVATICAAGFLSLPVFTQAAVAPLIVEFENAPPLPLFDQANFLPGQAVTRWVKVTNNTNTIQTQKIAVEAINATTTGDLASQLDLTIREGAIVLYNKTLEQFFDDGEIYFADLAGSGSQAQYDFSIAFKSGANNDFQGKGVGFDLLVGFQGQEGGSNNGGGGASGGGAVLPPGLTIPEESVVITTTTQASATITWTTSYQSTSQVIYAMEGGTEEHSLDLSDNVGTPPYPPKYGYEHTTLEYNTSPRVTFHTVTLDGLESGSEYYFRPVSHGSLAISRERSFTTKEAGEANVAAGEAEPLIRINNIEGNNTSQSIQKGAEQGLLTEGEEGLLQQQEESQQGESSKDNSLKNALMASIGLFPADLAVLTLLALIIILYFIIVFLIKKKKKEKRESSKHF